VKILYISNAQEITGWGESSYWRIRGMVEAGLDVYHRGISFGAPRRQCVILDDLESKSSKNYDLVIQETLPHLYSKMRDVKHVGAYHTEGSFIKSMWHKYINLMDESWVPSYSSWADSDISGVKNDIKIVPIPINFGAYKNIPKTASMDGIADGFNFCFVGEFVKRKNLRALLTAFHLEFHPSENVNLFLKLHKSGLSGDECLQLFQVLDQDVVNGLKIKGRSHKIFTMCGHEEKNNLLSLMSQCHCFVNPAYGDSWNIPAMEAMALGLNVIYNKNIGTADFANHPHCYPISSTYANCFGAVESLPQLYNGHDYWQSVDIESLRNAMRDAYINRHNVDRKSIRDHVEKYDYKKIGELICKIIK
jgi:glycosyltransferase involved in cell wall biosynthesis